MTYRAIEVSHLPQVVPVDQAAPMLSWIKIADLVIDDQYQRPLIAGNWLAIRKIAEAFRWGRFTPVLVSPIEEGRYAVIDGQHRCHAAALCGFAAVPCMVVHLAQAEQASSFAWVNGNVTRISQHQLYKAGLAAGEAWAERCQWAVEQAGCQLMTFHGSSKSKKARQIFCIGMVRSFVKRGHVDALRAGLAAISGYDVDGRVALYSEYILAPWCKAIAEVPGAADADLVALLHRFDPFKVLDIVAKKNAGRNSGGMATARKDAFVILIKRHLRDLAVAA